MSRQEVVPGNWVVVRFDYYLGFMVEAFDTEEEARKTFGEYPQGIQTWGNFLCEVKDGGFKP